MILADHQIKKAIADGRLVIAPFVPEKVRQVDGKSVASFGLSPFGYDMRVADEWKTPIGGRLDPKDPDATVWMSERCPYFDILPGGFVLARSVEYFEIPANITCRVEPKSTYLRCGIVLCVSPLEAGWRGYVTLEIYNVTNLPARIYANEGIGQVLFFEGEECEVPYTGGKYDNQGAEIVLARV